MTLIRGSLISGCAMVLALGCGRTTGLGRSGSGDAGGVLVTGGAGGMPAFGGSTATGGQGGAGTAGPCTDALGAVAQGYLFTCPNDYTSAEQWPATCSSGHGHLGSCNGFLALLVSPGTWGKECYYDQVSRVLVGAVAQDDVPDFCGRTSYTLVGGSYPSDCPLALLADLGDCMRATGGAGPGTGGTGGMGGMGGAGGAGRRPGSGGTTATSGQTTCSSTEPCAQGLCMGVSCRDTWTCVEDGRPCPPSLADYCGCDGVTFQDSENCPTRPYASRGACGQGTNCDQRDVACKMLPPTCGPGQFPGVVGSCWDGTCVPLEQCLCTVAEECPDPYNHPWAVSSQRRNGPTSKRLEWRFVCDAGEMARESI
jgi:hypothetical protein